MNAIEILLTTNNTASGVLKSFTGDLDSMGAKLQSAGAQLTAMTAPLTAFLGAAVKAASDQQTALAQLDSVIRSTGRSYTETFKQANELADSLARITRFSDDTILSAENLLLTFTSIGHDIFPDVTKAVLDMSTAMEQDLKSSAIQIGKALNDPITGLTALRRVGVQFTDAQEEMIKGMVEAGDLMGAQKAILAELNKEFGGSAEAAGKTFAGALDILKNKFGELQERIGFAIMYGTQPLVTQIGNVIDKITAWVEANPELTATIVKVTGGLALLGPALIVVGTAMRAISTVAPVLSLALGAITSPITLIVGAIAAAGVALNAFSESVSTVMTRVGTEVNERFGATVSLFEYFASLIEHIGANISAKGFFRGLGEEVHAVFTIFDDGSSVIGTFLQTLGFSQQQADELSRTINEGVIGQLGRAIGDFITELPSNLSLVPFYFTYYFGKVWSAVQPVLQPIIDWFTGTGTDSFGGVLAMLPEWIFQNITAPLQGIWLAVQPLVQPIIDWFNNDLGRIIQEVGGWIDTNIVTPLEDLWTTLQPTFQQIADFIETIFQPVIDVINQALDSWEMLRRMGGGQPIRALPGETAPGVPANPNQLVPGQPTPFLPTDLSVKQLPQLRGLAQLFLDAVGGAMDIAIDLLTSNLDKNAKEIVDSATKQGVIIRISGKRLSDSLDMSGKQIADATTRQITPLSSGAAMLVNSLSSAFGYVVASMQAQQAPILSGAAQLAQSVVGALANLWGQITQFVRDNINATAQGYDYGAGRYPDTFTGTPFPHDFAGRYSAGVPYRVGVGAQPEVFIPDSNGFAYPNADRAGRSVTIEGDLNLSFPNITDLTDPRQMERVIDLLFEQLEAAT